MWRASKDLNVHLDVLSLLRGRGSNNITESKPRRSINEYNVHLEPLHGRKWYAKILSRGGGAVSYNYQPIPLNALKLVWCKSNIRNMSIGNLCDQLAYSLQPTITPRSPLLLTYTVRNLAGTSSESPDLLLSRCEPAASPI